MEGFWAFLRRIDPRLQYFQDEEIVALDQARVFHPAFKVAEAFLDQRWAYLTGRERRESKALEFIGIATRAVANLHHYVGKAARWDRDHCFSRRAEGREGEIGLTDDTRDERRLELQHHVPGHRHDVRATFASRRQQNNRAGFQQLVNLRKMVLPYCHAHSLAL